jgi:uncharacterized protein YggE
VPGVNAVEITVQGSSTMFHPAERATVRARVGLEDSDAGRVYAAVTAQAQRAHASVAALHDPDRGPVTWWSAQSVQTWERRPWNQDGKQLPLVFHARTNLQVKFRDFTRLSAWLREMAGVPGFGVDHVEWALTAGRRQELVRAARVRAVQDARAKAQAYAEALGLSDLSVVALADAGMLGEGLHPVSPAVAAFKRGAASDAPEPDLQLVPEDIEVTAQVDARFRAAAG